MALLSVVMILLLLLATFKRACFQELGFCEVDDVHNMQERIS